MHPASTREDLHPRTWTPDPGTNTASALVSMVLFVVLGLSACGEHPREALADPDRPVEEDSATQGLSGADQLRQLGYADYAESVADPSEESVVLYDASRIAPGYNTIACNGQVFLFDSQAKVLHSWRTEGVRWTAPMLLANGDVLVSGFAARGENRRSGYCLGRLRWDGSQVWQRWIPSHHDVEVTPDGRVATLTKRAGRLLPEIHSEYHVRDEGVALLELRSGRRVKDRSLYDMLAASPELFQFQEVKAKAAWEREGIDLLHSNAVEFMRHEHLVERSPIYAMGNVLVTIRHQDSVVIFDFEAGRVVWAWGQGVISGPHDGQVLENGNILLFDNGLERGWSRAVEVDPLTREIVWEWHSPEPTDFFTRGRGSAQRLENGNTLLADSDSGEALEVSPQGEVLWHFRNPQVSEDGKRATFAFIHRLPTQFVDRLLARVDQNR